MAEQMKLPDKNGKYGRIVFNATPKYREKNAEEYIEFVCKYTDYLCKHFDVVTTGGTHVFFYDNICQFDYYHFTFHDKIILDSGEKINRKSFDKWKKPLEDKKIGIEPKSEGFKGMIKLIHELVNGEIDAVIHLKTAQDISAKPDSAVLSREANVYGVPIATNIATADTFINSWREKILGPGKHSGIFIDRSSQKNTSGFKGTNLLALVAHDNMKSELARFAVEYKDAIFHDYNGVIATETTGNLLKRFFESLGREDLAKRVHCYHSGPKGGDLQIACAVVEGWCKKIIFFQDPSVSHPHEWDIRLFEQAVAEEDLRVEMATNYESARLLIEQ